MNRNKQLEPWQEKTLINQGDYLANIVQAALQTALNAQFEQFIGAKDYERTDQRKGHRNGSYERQLYTRVGSIILQVCRDRAGEFSPEVFERYQRVEKALVCTIIEAYLTGTSTRKITKIVEELCGFGLSKSVVSSMIITIDEELQAWRERPLLKPFRYLIIDARYEKVRENGRVVSKAFPVVVGIDYEGDRDIIGCRVVNSESYESWDDFFRSLQERGLHGVEYVVTDENKGLRKALMKYFQGVKLQRCQVHFMRNLLGKISQNEQPEAVRLMQEVFAAETKEEAIKRVHKVSEFLISKKKSGVADWLEESIEDTLQVLDLPLAHRKKMKSTNMLERVNQELKRRSRVVRIFPNEASCLRLLSALCQEISEDWGSRKYLNMNV